MIRLPNQCVRHAPRDITKARAIQRIRKTWLTPIQKALTPGDPEYEWLHEIADGAAPNVRARFLAAIKAIRGTVQEAELRAALNSGSLERVLHVLGMDKDLTQFNGAILPPLTSTVHGTGLAALNATPALAELGGSLRMKLNVVNPKTVQAVRTYGFNLIRQISDDTRDGIRAVVANAMEFGGHPYDQARQIRGLIGLTKNQANTVANFRRLLSEGNADALTRELRDHRFNGTLRQALGADATIKLSPEQINQQVQRYANRMLAARAENIARTETINAARLGTQAAWEQSTESGLLERHKVRQGWMVTPDDRLCEFLRRGA